ncbi:hypothetical protein A2230_06345 [candidate division WOR-1 bacterium RIFOXYA2_FULL_36_21]|nr:MAG: hypothetical protein A2230_06345 [candidate division WOR-1 bacterium RIFOXYA2_FULL_36_21]OGC14298.1 MAG: hypothetical protein A2282_00040 [candidate division WOR-1 bacterium RIFOXYA12_FULL_36_13]
MFKKIGLLLAFIFLSFFCSGYAEPDLPSYTGYVNDFANVMDVSTQKKIAAICNDLKTKTGAELAVVTVKSIYPLDSKTYAVKLFEKWGIGQKDKDSGILFLLAVDERRVEIEVGYGLEGVLNDAKAGRLLDDYVLPAFKKGDFSLGMFMGTHAIANAIIKGSDPANNTGIAGAVVDQYLPIIIFIVIVLLIIFSRGRFLWLFLGGGGLGGGGGFGGNNRGGFGGFGGGRSGGGGAGRGF